MVQLFSELYQGTNNPIFLKEVLRFTDIPNRGELIREIDIIPKQQQQIKQLGQLVQNLNEELKRARREEINAKQAKQLKEHETKQAIQTIKHKAALEELFVEAEAEIDEQVLKHQLDLKEIVLRKQLAGVHSGNGGKG